MSACCARKSRHVNVFALLMIDIQIMVVKGSSAGTDKGYGVLTQNWRGFFRSASEISEECCTPKITPPSSPVQTFSD